tara:strand:+ start:452 stop:2176 length:1725 start_codon:yes stop_codon:yes gene_type:complete
MAINPKKHYDVVIIGAGISGLTSSALFRKAGLSCCVVETNPIPGGYLQGFNRKDYRFDSAIHWINNLGPKGLVTRIFEIIGTDYPKAKEQKRIRRFVSNEFDYLVTNKPDGFKEALIRDFPEDEKGIERFFKTARVLGKTLESHTFLSRTWDSMNFIERVQHTAKMMKFIIPFAPLVRFTGDEGVQKGLKKYFSNPNLRKIFASEPDLLSCLIPISWAYTNDFQTPPEGGSQVIPEWLEHVTTTLGGGIFYKTKVNKILLEGDTAVGVKVEHRGEEHIINSKYVIAACDAELLYTKLLPPSAKGDIWKAKLNKAEMYASAITIALGLDCPSEELGMREEIIYLADFNLARGALGDGDPHTSGIHILASSARDKSLSLPEHGTLTLFIPGFIEQFDYWKTERDEKGSYVRGEAYKKCKQEVAEIVLDRVVDQLIPNLREHILYTDIATPITHERYTGNKGGTMMGQRPGRINSQGKMASYKTPYKNLIQSGHWADLGGGIPIAIKSSMNTTFMVLRQENNQVFRLLADYMSGKIEIDKVRSADLLTNYEPSWVLKPTPAQKIMARKKKLAEENQG